MSAYTESPARREARAKARTLVLTADVAQLDYWREPTESRESFKDRMFRLMAICPFAALAVLGA
jgi:hypothetical protein